MKRNNGERLEDEARRMRHPELVSTLRDYVARARVGEDVEEAIDILEGELDRRREHGTNPRLLKVRREGIVTSDKAALQIATKILKSKPSGTRLLLSFYNGTDLFIREKSDVRCATQAEYDALKLKANPETWFPSLEEAQEFATEVASGDELPAVYPEDEVGGYTVAWGKYANNRGDWQKSEAFWEHMEEMAGEEWNKLTPGQRMEEYGGVTPGISVMRFDDLPDKFRHGFIRDYADSCFSNEASNHFIDPRVARMLPETLKIEVDKAILQWLARSQGLIQIGKMMVPIKPDMWLALGRYSISPTQHNYLIRLTYDGRKYLYFNIGTIGAWIEQAPYFTGYANIIEVHYNELGFWRTFLARSDEWKIDWFINVPAHIRSRLKRRLQLQETPVAPAVPQSNPRRLHDGYLHCYPPKGNPKYFYGPPAKTGFGDEWVVRCYKDGKRYPDGDYFSDDKQDAIDTAKAETARNNPEPLCHGCMGKITWKEYKSSPYGLCKRCQEEKKVGIRKNPRKLHDGYLHCPSCGIETSECTKMYHQIRERCCDWCKGEEEVNGKEGGEVART